MKNYTIGRTQTNTITKQQQTTALAYKAMLMACAGLLFLSLSTHVYAQTGRVGINTDDPKATLHIKANNTPAQPTDGVLIPSLDEFPTTNPGSDQDGMLVFITGNGTPAKGFYYWDHTATQWQALAGSGTGGATKIDDLSDGKSDNDGTEDGSSIFLGIEAGANDDGDDNRNIGIGYNAQVPNNNGSNQIRMGNGNITYAGIEIPWSITFKRGSKSQIRALPYGLNLVKQLKPVDYIRKNNEHKTREIGFIAQDIENTLKQLGYNDQGLLSKNEEGLMGIRYNDFIPVLTKAIQEQQALIEAQQQQMQAQQQQMQTQQQEIEALKAMLEKIMEQRQ